MCLMTQNPFHDGLESMSPYIKNILDEVLLRPNSSYPSIYFKKYLCYIIMWPIVCAISKGLSCIFLLRINISLTFHNIKLGKLVRPLLNSPTNTENHKNKELFLTVDVSSFGFSGLISLCDIIVITTFGLCTYLYSYMHLYIHIYAKRKMKYCKMSNFL